MSIALCYHEAHDKCDPQVNGEHRAFTPHSLFSTLNILYLLVSASEQPEIFAIIAMPNGEIAAIKPTGLWYSSMLTCFQG